MNVASLLYRIVDLALPPRCPSCGAVVDGDDRFCADCWKGLELFTGKGCSRCGIPVPPGIVICAPCLSDPPDHDGVRAALSYGEAARTLAVRLKHGRRPGLARLAARLMARHLPSGDWLIVPVPLHRWRLWSRGFNQSLLIARRLSRIGGQPLSVDALSRRRRTPLLRGLSPRQRKAAVRGVFVADPAQVRGRDIILVDDVYTTGATANACARALRKAGAQQVIVLCWARVVRDGVAH